MCIVWLCFRVSRLFVVIGVGAIWLLIISHDMRLCIIRRMIKIALIAFILLIMVVSHRGYTVVVY